MIILRGINYAANVNSQPIGNIITVHCTSSVTIIALIGIILFDKERDVKKKMSIILNPGGGISTTGDIYDMMEIDKSSSFAIKCRRRRGNLHSIVKIAVEDIKNAMEDEIEATLISEHDVEYYL